MLIVPLEKSTNGCYSRLFRYVLDINWKDHVTSKSFSFDYNQKRCLTFTGHGLRSDQSSPQPVTQILLWKRTLLLSLRWCMLPCVTSYHCEHHMMHRNDLWNTYCHLLQDTYTLWSSFLVLHDEKSTRLAHFPLSSKLKECSKIICTSSLTVWLTTHHTWIQFLDWINCIAQLLLWVVWLWSGRNFAVCISSNPIFISLIPDLPSYIIVLRNSAPVRIQFMLQF